MKKSVLKTVQVKYFYIPAIFTTIVIAGVFTYFMSIDDKIIFPSSRNFNYAYYTDEPDGGRSQIKTFNVTDSVIHMDFNLKDGFFSPYVGIRTSPLNSKFIDAGKYNQIKLKLSGKNINRVGISIYTPLAEPAKRNDSDESLFHSYLNISSRAEEYTIPISQLKHPDWWEDLHQLPGSANDRPDLKRIGHLNINTAFIPNIEDSKSLEVYTILFTRSNSQLFAILGTSYVVLISLLFGFLHLKKKPVPNITISYQPVETISAKEGDERAIDFINRNFQNCELNLEFVAKETGVSQRRITQLISSDFQCNFKTYINRIRITEAKRLLRDSDLNMGEIAFKVGFNNQSHFNRVFKNELDTSPSAYRNKHQA